MNWNLQPVTTTKTYVTKVRGELKTIGTADPEAHLLRYQDHAAWLSDKLTALIRTMSCEAVRLNK